MVAMLGEVGGLLRAAPAEVADGGDDLEVGRQGAEDGIEPNLVVACAGGAVADGDGSLLTGDADHVLRLDHPLHANAEGIDGALEIVSCHEVADPVPVEFVGRVHGEVGDSAGLDGALLDAGQLIGVKGAGVDGGGNHLVAERLTQIDHAETGIEAAGEGENTAGKNSHPRVTSVRRKRPQKRLRICLAKAPPLRRARTADCSERRGGSQRKLTPRVK